MDAYIKAISYYLPQEVLTNEQLVEQFPEWTVEKVAKKIGIRERHVAAPNETAGDMAYQAAERLFTEHAVDRQKVDFLLLCTQSADYVLPSTACVLQQRLGLPTTVGALDFDLGCSGFVYGLALAKGLIAAHVARNVLLLTSETYTKYLHPRDKGNRTIFGDGAAATLISTEGSLRIGEFVLGTDGSGAESLIVHTGAARQRKGAGAVSFDESGNPSSPDYLYMNGADVLAFTLERVPAMVAEVLKKNHLEAEQIDRYVFHQANSYMLEFLRKKLHIPHEKMVLDLAQVGNTVSSTIPIALYDSGLCDKETQDIHHILLAGFGVGFSWGGVVVESI